MDFLATLSGPGVRSELQSQDLRYASAKVEARKKKNYDVASQLFRSRCSDCFGGHSRIGSNWRHDENCGPDPAAFGCSNNGSLSATRTKPDRCRGRQQ